MLPHMRRSLEETCRNILQKQSCDTLIDTHGGRLMMLTFFTRTHSPFVFPAMQLSGSEILSLYMLVPLAQSSF